MLAQAARKDSASHSGGLTRSSHKPEHRAQAQLAVIVEGFLAKRNAVNALNRRRRSYARSAQALLQKNFR
jgi:hypothetical protein